MKIFPPIRFTVSDGADSRAINFSFFLKKDLIRIKSHRGDLREPAKAIGLDELENRKRFFLS
jgi:hypothetical protein